MTMSTTERTAKTRATKEAKRSAFAAQTIEIDNDWRVIRADELNWELQYQGKFKGFYNNLGEAFRSIPAKMLTAAAKNSLADVQRSLQAIHVTIENALSRAQFTGVRVGEGCRTIMDEKLRNLDSRRGARLAL